VKGEAKQGKVHLLDISTEPFLLDLTSSFTIVDQLSQGSRKEPPGQPLQLQDAKKHVHPTHWPCAYELKIERTRGLSPFLIIFLPLGYTNSTTCAPVRLLVKAASAGCQHSVCVRLCAPRICKRNSMLNLVLESLHRKTVFGPPMLNSLQGNSKSGV